MKSAFKRLIESATRKAGFELIPTWRLERLPEAGFMRDLLGEYAVQTVVDVGANVGQYRDFLRNQVGYMGRVLSFEPQRECAARLRSRAKSDPAWEVFETALGATTETREFNIMQSTVFNSFLKPGGDVTPHMKELNTVQERRSIQVQRLDEVFPKLVSSQIPECFFLKLDTQGFDLEVLKGASGLLNRVVAVQTEASVVPIYEGMPGINETLSYLNGLQFDLANAAPVTRDEALRAIEFDLVFLNRAFSAKKLSGARQG